MELSFYINQLNFKDNTKLKLKEDSIVVFVGPNNSGKSKALKEIQGLSRAQSVVNHIVNDIEISSSGTEKQLEEKLKPRLLGTSYMYRDGATNSGMGSRDVLNYWKSQTEKPQKNAPVFSSFFIKFLDTTARLNLVSPAGNIDVFKELKTHPIQEIKADEAKELLFSEYFRKAFGEDVIVNHAAGASIPLHVGKRPRPTLENDRVSHVYQELLRQQPFLHEQGDGMKSFAGIFLALFAEDFKINLVDEPEAFLHPPQAMLLGQMTATKLASNKQLFIATHSEHLLKGLLDSAAERVIIVRLERDKMLSRAKILENKDIQTIWEDSLLRHSNILDGIFHKKVALVESDSDCLFYNTLVTTVVEKKGLTSPDILFVQSGGKHRFPIVIKALKALEVPLVVIGDFDFYHDENPIRKVYQELGGTWDDIKSDFMKVKKAIDEKLPELKTEDLKKEIEGILEKINTTVAPEYAIKDIHAALKKASPWKQAKASGKFYLPAGEASLAFERVQQKLAEKHIFVLEMGEIEAFDKGVGGHGPKWVNKVIEKDIKNDSELAAAKDFVTKTLLF